MNTQLQKVRQEALMLCAPVFHKMEEISLFNMQKVLEAFRKNHLSAYHFAPSNGYGYGDPAGRSWRMSGAIFFMRKRLWYGPSSFRVLMRWRRFFWRF